VKRVVVCNESFEKRETEDKELSEEDIGREEYVGIIGFSFYCEAAFCFLD